MIDKKCLKLSLSDYFETCKIRFMRGLILITDKQYLFYSDINNIYKTHNDIVINLENLIHPNHKVYSIDAVRETHVLVSSLGNELFIELPKNRNLSYSQYLFLYKILKEVEEINFKLDEKIGIVIINDQLVYENDNPDIILIISILKKLINKHILFGEEKIIGKYLKNDYIFKTMKFYIGLEKCLYINDLYDSLNICHKYYLNSYYNKYLKIIFFNYTKVKKLFDKIKNITDENYTLDNINYNNIENKLRQLYNSIIKTKKKVKK